MWTPIHEILSKLMKMGANFPKSFQRNLIELLRAFEGIVVWEASEIEGLDHSLVVHRLSIDPDKKPVQQNRRILVLERKYH